MPQYTTPPTHATGDLFPATDWNSYIRDDLAFMHDRGTDLPSAATITPTNQFHRVTGTTTITTIAAPTGTGQGGNRLALKFQSAGCTITAGVSIILTGGAFVSAANQIITFVWDDLATAWVETGRTGGSSSVLKKTTATVATGAGAVDLFNGEFTLSGGQLGPTGVMEIVAEGDFAYGTTGTPGLVWSRLALLLGSTTLLDTGNPAAAGAFTDNGRRKWNLRATILARNASNNQSGSMQIETRQPSGANAPANVWATGNGEWNPNNLGGDLWGSGVFTSTVDMTLPQALKLTVVPSNSGSGDFTIFGAHVKFL